MNISYFIWSAHQKIDISVVPTSGLLCMMYEYSCNEALRRNTLSVLLGIHLGVELLDHMVTLCLNIWRNQLIFQSGCTVYIPKAMCKSPNFSASSLRVFLSVPAPWDNTKTPSLFWLSPHHCWKPTEWRHEDLFLTLNSVPLIYILLPLHTSIPDSL